MRNHHGRTGQQPRRGRFASLLLHLDDDPVLFCDCAGSGRQCEGPAELAGTRRGPTATT